MTNFQGSHLLSVDQFELQDLLTITQLAHELEPYARGERRTRVLEGAILATLFFEPSTRTRVSFGAAFNRLGGAVRDTTGIESSSLAKGETLFDTARVISGYVDAIVLRHPRAGSAREFAAGALVPVFNGGDGAGEHPTQALLDLYTISKELRTPLSEVRGIRIALVGDLKHGRVAHSLVKALSRLQTIELVCVAPSDLELPGELVELMRQRGHIVRSEPDLRAGLAGAAVVYVTRLQRERFESAADIATHLGRYQLNRELFRKCCHPATVIMHALPRDSRQEAGELSNDLNDEPALAIFRQADNGIPVRMALFALTLGVQHQVHAYASDVPWQRRRT